MITVRVTLQDGDTDIRTIGIASVGAKEIAGAKRTFAGVLRLIADDFERGAYDNQKVDTP